MLLCFLVLTLGRRLGGFTERHIHGMFREQKYGKRSIALHLTVQTVLVQAICAPTLVVPNFHEPLFFEYMIADYIMYSAIMYSKTACERFLKIGMTHI